MTPFNAHRHPGVVILFWTLMGSLCGVVSGDSETLTAVPDASAQAAVQKSVNELYKTDLARHDAASCSRLAGKLLEAAQEKGTDPTERFVFLRQAQDLAESAGDVAASLGVVDVIISSFAVDPFETRLAALKQLGHCAKTTENQKNLAGAAMQLVDDAAAADKASTSSQAAAIATTAAEKSRDSATIARVRKARKASDRSREDSTKAEAALQQLKRAPEDPAANTVVGNYFCIVRGDWEKGLPYLARGSEPAIQALAKRDLAPAKSAADMASMADAWWDFALKAEPLERNKFKTRAAFWYGRAIGELAGLRQTLAQQRIDEAATMTSTGARQIDLGNSAYASRPNPALKEVKVLQVTYGVADRSVDLTDDVVKTLAKDPFFVIDADQSLGDPAGGVSKQLRIRYTAGGKTLDTSVGDYETITIPEIPVGGISLPNGRAAGFQVVAARWGVGLKWFDVTDQIRQQVKSADERSNYSYPSGDIFDGAHKHLVVWFDSAGRRYCVSIRDDHTDGFTLTAPK